MISNDKSRNGILSALHASEGEALLNVRWIIIIITTKIMRNYINFILIYQLLGITSENEIEIVSTYIKSNDVTCIRRSLYLNVSIYISHSNLLLLYIIIFIIIIIHHILNILIIITMISISPLINHQTMMIIITWIILIIVIVIVIIIIIIIE